MNTIPFPARLPCDLPLAGLFPESLVAVLCIASGRYYAAATFSYLCLACGVLNARRPAIHAKLMASGILLDLAIVACLEIRRGAVKTALSFSLSPLQQLHVGASSAATLLYFPAVTLGLLLISRRKGGRTRKFHRGIGIAAFAFRTLGFALMFSLLWKKP